MAKSLRDDHTYFPEPYPDQPDVANETVGLALSGVNRPEGVLARNVDEGGPADRAGIRPATRSRPSTANRRLQSAIPLSPTSSRLVYPPGW